MIKRYDMTEHCGQHMCDCDIVESTTGEYVEYSDYAAVLAENAAMKDTLGYICNRGNEPEYHDCGMGCGLEDRGITDRYEAMYHVWESAMGRVYSEVIPDAMPETPATDAALAAVRIQGVEAFADGWEAETARIVEGAFFYPQIAQREEVSKAARQYVAELREAQHG